MKYCAVIVLCYFAGCSTGYDTVIDCYSNSQFKKHALPSFSSFFMNVRSNELSRVDIYIQMPYNRLHFEKSENIFKASYSITFIVRNKLKEIVQTREIDRPIAAKTYEETVSSRFDFYLQSFSLIPGSYSWEMVATDNQSKLRYGHTETFNAYDFSRGEISASSILLLDGISSGEKGVSLHPILPASISLLKDSVGTYQELYNINAGDTVSVSESFFAPHWQPWDYRKYSNLTPPYGFRSDRCDQPYDSLYYFNDSTFVANKNGTVQFIQFMPLPAPGSSNMERRIVIKGAGRTNSSIFKRKSFRREQQYRSTVSREEVLSMMKFILRDEEYDSLLISTGNEQQRRMNAFWDDRNGMIRKYEFESKISEANTLFTTCVDGSRTAMGIIYTICGMPDYVDCKGSFIETWYYNVGDRLYPIQFRKENETSLNYELTPFSVNEFVWQYYVDRWRRKK